MRLVIKGALARRGLTDAARGGDVLVEDCAEVGCRGSRGRGSARLSLGGRAGRSTGGEGGEGLRGVGAANMTGLAAWLPLPDKG